MENKTCPKCNETKQLNEFYHRTGRKTTAGPLCKTCFNRYCISRWIERKIDAIKYKGGKCVDCTNSYPELPYVIFEFHHLDPNTKDMVWNEMRKTSWSKITTELDKCVLLCSNCHKIRHHLNK
jgi:hypothetical protein